MRLTESHGTYRLSEHLTQCTPFPNLSNLSILKKHKETMTCRINTQILIHPQKVWYNGIWSIRLLAVIHKIWILEGSWTFMMLRDLFLCVDIPRCFFVRMSYIRESQPSPFKYQLNGWVGSRQSHEARLVQELQLCRWQTTPQETCQLWSTKQRSRNEVPSESTLRNIACRICMNKMFG